MRRNLKFSALLMCICCTITVAVPNEQLVADEALSLVQQGDSFTSGPWILGMQFVANDDFDIVSLGFMDWDQNGLVESHQVGLWDLSGNLLASTTVNGGDPLVAGFRYSGISATALTAGESYIVASLGSANADPFSRSDQGNIFNVTPLISITGARWDDGSGGLVFPTNNPTEFYYTTASFQTSVIPEPSSFAVVMGIVGVAFLRRRK